ASPRAYSCTTPIGSCHATSRFILPRWGATLSASSKRETLSRWAGKLGLLQLMGWVNRRPGLLVLAYHRIGTHVGHLYDDEIISATEGDFRAQLEFLRRHFDVIGLEDLLRLAEGDFEVQRPTVLVTFDDGYRDNHGLALPILRDLNVPAV